MIIINDIILNKIKRLKKSEKMFTKLKITTNNIKIIGQKLKFQYVSLELSDTLLLYDRINFLTILMIKNLFPYKNMF